MSNQLMLLIHRETTKYEKCKNKHQFNGITTTEDFRKRQGGVETSKAESFRLIGQDALGDDAGQDGDHSKAAEDNPTDEKK